MNKRNSRRIKRHRRFLKKGTGSSLKPRLVVIRSIKNLSAEVIDDTTNKTIFYLSTLDKQIKQKFPYAGNIKAAQYFGEIFAQRAKEKGVTRVLFDRAGYLFHGRIKAFAEALRKGGMEF